MDLRGRCSDPPRNSLTFPSSDPTSFRHSHGVSSPSIEPFLDVMRSRHSARQASKTERSLRDDSSDTLSFSNNDYLGLSQHPEVKQAAWQSIHAHGTGSQAARLLAPNYPEYQRLEEALAAWKSTERSLLFAAGYLAPLGVIPSLASSRDTVIIERNAHACLFDGAKLSNAKIRIFNRRDSQDLFQILQLTRKLNPQGKILIVTESLHSMDGDRLPLKEIVDLKEEFSAWLLLDEAHAGGIFGPQGNGLATELGLTARVEVQMGTLGKALGSSGGFVAASGEIIRHLVNEARTFLFGTALAPAQAAAAFRALQIIQSQEGEELRIKLRANIETFHSNRETSLAGPIQPVPCHDNQTAVDMAHRLLEQGLHVPAIRPPTVPEGTARLRVSLSARHSPQDITRLCSSLHELLPLP
ncbi:MAG: 8-amino-7-oxononanoate synthase [Verrucomicrobia bacterium]|nr:8-amino-7-oxononanoate synthase [Verrucomicrobiota bacterium]